MTTSIRGHGSTVEDVTAITIGVPAGVQDGELLVLVLGFRERLSSTTTSPATPAGWTIVGSHAGSQSPAVKSYVYQRVASSEPASYTVHLDDTTSYIGAAILAFADCDTNTGVAQLALVSSDGYEYSITAPSVTTTVDGALVVRVLQDADDTLDESFTPAGHTAWFVDEAVDHWAHGVYYQRQASAGATGTATLILDSNAYDLLNAITFTVNPARNDETRLRYAPPELDPGHTTIDLGTETGTYWDVPGQDVLILPRDSEDTRITVQVVNARRVKILGGTFRPRGSHEATLFFQGIREWVYIEGVDIDNASCTGAQDGILMHGADGYAPDIYVQNCRITGIQHGVERRGDAFQTGDAHKTTGGVYIDKLTVETGHRGLTVHGNGVTQAAEIHRANLRYATGAIKGPLLRTSGADGTTYPVMLDRLYISEATATALDPDAQSIDDGEVTFAPYTQITGTCYEGESSGDFVPPGSVGLGYTSPGYEPAPVQSLAPTRVEDTDTFGAARVSMGSGGRLYPAPVIGTPRVIIDLEDPANESRDYWLLDDNTDYLIIGRRDRGRATNKAQFRGGRNIHVHGGYFRPTSYGLATLWFEYCHGEIYVEGVHIDNAQVTASGDTQDAIGFSADPNTPHLAPNLYLYKCRLEGIRGSSDGVHADGIQQQPRAWRGGIYLDHVTIKTTCQGIFIDPQFGATHKEARLDYVDIEVVDLGVEYPWMIFWFARVDSRKYPIALRANGGPVYVDDLSKYGLDTGRRGVFPIVDNTNPGEWYGKRSGDRIDWPNLYLSDGTTRCITGYVTVGRPPGGDFVPASDVGLSYPEPER